jgi:hypothetical protein
VIIEPLTAHIDGIDNMPLGIHFVQDMPSLQCDGLYALQISATLPIPYHQRKRTSSVTWNLTARSLTPLSSVRPVIMPFILTSAKGDRLPRVIKSPS